MAYDSRSSLREESEFLLTNQNEIEDLDCSIEENPDWVTKIVVDAFAVVVAVAAAVASCTFAHRFLHSQKRPDAFDE